MMWFISYGSQCWLIIKGMCVCLCVCYRRGCSRKRKGTPVKVCDRVFAPEDDEENTEHNYAPGEQCVYLNLCVNWERLCGYKELLQIESFKTISLLLKQHLSTPCWWFTAVEIIFCPNSVAVFFFISMQVKRVIMFVLVNLLISIQHTNTHTQTHTQFICHKC